MKKYDCIFYYIISLLKNWEYASIGIYFKPKYASIQVDGIICPSLNVDNDLIYASTKVKTN